MEYSNEFVKIEDVLELDSVRPIEKIIAEEIDNAISEEIAAVIKKYIPRSTVNKEKVLELAKRLLKETNDD